MAIGGLWHGVSWTFLVWGLLHGTGLAVFRLWQAMRKGAKPSTQPGVRLASGLLTFHFVLLAWIFFRAANMDAAMKILSQIGSLRYSFENATPAFLGVLLLAAAAQFVPKAWYDGSLRLFGRTPAVLQAASLALLVMAIQLVSTRSAAPFIYSKF